MKVNKSIKEKYNEFVKTNGNEPKFADVKVQFDGEDEEPFDTIIKLRDFNPTDTENDPDDGSVIYYSHGLEGLLDINKTKEADFKIVEINGFCNQY